MPGDAPYDAALCALQEISARLPEGSLWRHQKSGGVYRIVTHVLIEATLEPAVIYRKPDAAIGETPPVTWCRPAVEFLDGRFQPLAEGSD